MADNPVNDHHAHGGASIVLLHFFGKLTPFGDSNRLCKLMPADI